MEEARSSRYQLDLVTLKRPDVVDLHIGVVRQELLTFCRKLLSIVFCKIHLSSFVGGDQRLQRVSLGYGNQRDLVRIAISCLASRSHLMTNDFQIMCDVRCHVGKDSTGGYEGASYRRDAGGAAQDSVPVVHNSPLLCEAMPRLPWGVLLWRTAIVMGDIDYPISMVGHSCTHGGRCQTHRAVGCL